MKFLTYMITSVAALPLVEIENGEVCGAITPAKDAAGSCKSKKCNAVLTKAAATTTTRRLAEAAATPPTCQEAQKTCGDIVETAEVKDPKTQAVTTPAVGEAECVAAAKTSGCKWVKASGTTTTGKCEVDCKCSGTTVVSVTVAFVAAILLL